MQIAFHRLCDARLHVLLLVVLFSLTALGTPALAEKRIALLVGNSGYTNISSLKNPANDAKLMATALEAAGFEVILALDADRLALGRAIRRFGTGLRAAGADAVGLFYYAGHGVQHRGQNYLIPLNAEIVISADLEIEAFRLEDVLQQMSLAGNALNLAILDACRNNPFPSSTRSTERGLARVTTFNESLIAFAAAPGQVALDGKGINSPYTAALVKAIATPGLSIEEVFKRTRLSVLGETEGAQTPWEQSSLTRNFYFTAKTPEKPPERTARSPAKPEVQKAPETADREVEVTFWNSVKDSGDPALLRAYLERYPDGLFAVIASLMIERIEAKPAEPVEAERIPAEDKEMAALDPGAASRTAPRETTREEAGPDLPRRIQIALSDIGCDPGPIDGEWGRNSRRALESFADHANVELPEQVVSRETLNLLEQFEARICPLVCSAREVERDGRCVAKTCPGGQRLDSAGRCVDRTTTTTQRPARQKPRTRKRPAKSKPGPWCTETERRLKLC